MGLAGQEGVQGVVEVVAPHRVEAVAADRLGADESGVVEVAFGDQVEGPILFGGDSARGVGQLGQEGVGRRSP